MIRVGALTGLRCIGQRSVMLGVALLAAGQDAWAGSASLEERAVDYCRKHLGERVGNGQCAALAFQALKAAGGRTRAGPDSPQKGDYVWGRLVYMIEASPDGTRARGKLSDVRAGDIVQYRDAEFARAHFHHHTAVVAFIDERTLRVYQQNAGGKQFVTEGAVRIDKLARGWIRIYQPIPAGR